MSDIPEIEVCDLLCIHKEAVEEVQAVLPNAEQVADMADLFKMFGDATRLRILCSLQARELCVCDLATVIGMNQSAVSHQLRLLKQSRLVKSRRDGKTVYYSLADDHVVTVLAQGMEHISE